MLPVKWSKHLIKASACSLSELANGNVRLEYVSGANINYNEPDAASQA